MPNLGLRLTPRGQLLLEPADDAPPLGDAVAARLEKSFAQGSGQGLLALGAGEVGELLPPVFAWWRELAARYVAGVCLQAGGTEDSVAIVAKLPPPSEAERANLTLTAPMMPGAEYLGPELLLALWTELGAALARSLADSGGDLQACLKRWSPAWNLVGRVHFNLAEQRSDPAAPFAFLATYTTRLSRQAKAQHLPLGQALREYAGAANREALLALLLPVQRAAERCDWVKAIVESGDIYHPLRWTAGEAARLLASVPELEQAGIIVRMPPAWRAGRPARPQVAATVGARPPAQTGLEALLDFSMEVTLDGAVLSKEEIRTLLAGSESLVLLRGQWVEIDRRHLGRAMQRFREAQALAERQGLTFAEAMRLLAGAAIDGTDGEAEVADWSKVTAGPWLAETLRALRGTEGSQAILGCGLNGTLRPYQAAGVEWLHLLVRLGLGGCLADDMGLGKTIQVLALLLILRQEATDRAPSLLVAPASLLANWSAEIERFAPDLRARVLHPSSMPLATLKQMTPDELAGTDLAITSYGTLLRTPMLSSVGWRLAILDEAQAIRNAGAKQAKAAKALRAKARIALTGTPIENHLGDLWSIFDYINPGLLGAASQFTRFTKAMAKRHSNPYGPLRSLVRPYILRRMKTDKAIIADLPEKTEVTAYCLLSRKQAALYAQTVAELEDALATADGIARKGLVLATMMRLKQICNHPSQWLNDGAWAEGDSGKLARLREISETVAARQEKMLVFTQFLEMTAPLAAFLGGVFGRPGLVLHGDTKVKARQDLVRTFQEDAAVPYFVLSLKAGGTGLNLTAASHVVHFDRWWNPAVENQASDRAYRIGQQKRVLVHKFVCRGTVEDKIDALIESKRGLAADLLSGAEEIRLTEMKDEELLRLVSLDLASAMKE